MSLTDQDLQAIKRIVNDSIDERVPIIIDEKVQPMLDQLENRLTRKIDDLALSVGQYSLEVTEDFRKLNAKIDKHLPLTAR